MGGVPLPFSGAASCLLARWLAEVLVVMATVPNIMLSSQQKSRQHTLCDGLFQQHDSQTFKRFLQHAHTLHMYTHRPCWVLSPRNTLLLRKRYAAELTGRSPQRKCSIESCRPSRVVLANLGYRAVNSFRARILSTCSYCCLNERQSWKGHGEEEGEGHCS